MLVHAHDHFRSGLPRTTEVGDGIPDDAVQIHNGSRRIVVFGVGSDSVDNLIGALGLIQNFPKCPAKRFLVVITLLHAAIETAGEIDNSRKRLLELMRNDRGHLPDNAGTFKVGNMLTRLYGFGLDHFTLFRALRSCAVLRLTNTDKLTAYEMMMKAAKSAKAMNSAFSRRKRFRFHDPRFSYGPRFNS